MKRCWTPKTSALALLRLFERDHDLAVHPHLTDSFCEAVRDAHNTYRRADAPFAHTAGFDFVRACDVPLIDPSVRHVVALLPCCPTRSMLVPDPEDLGRRIVDAAALPVLEERHAVAITGVEPFGDDGVVLLELRETVFSEAAAAPSTSHQAPADDENGSEIVTEASRDMRHNDADFRFV